MNQSICDRFLNSTSIVSFVPGAVLGSSGSKVSLLDVPALMGFIFYIVELGTTHCQVVIMKSYGKGEEYCFRNDSQERSL